MIEETTFDKLKKGLFEMLRGYPRYSYFGKIEYFLQDGGRSPIADTEEALRILKKHDIIEFASKEEGNKLNKLLPKEQREQMKARRAKPIWYRLAPRGLDLAISLMNQEHNKKLESYQEETLGYTRQTQGFNIETQKLNMIMAIFTISLFIIGVTQLIVTSIIGEFPFLSTISIFLIVSIITLLTFLFIYGVLWKLQPTITNFINIIKPSLP